MDFLSKNGELILKQLREHCKSLKMMDADDYQLKALAHSIDTMEEAAKFCRDNGNTFDMPTKTGTYPMVRPEYTVLKNEYQNILKYSAGFGLNPKDRSNIKGVDVKKPKKFETK
jgi:hypothetical protein